MRIAVAALGLVLAGDAAAQSRAAPRAPFSFPTVTTVDAVEAGLDTEFELLPVGGDSFHSRQYKNGKLIGDELDELIIFRTDGAAAADFELRGIAEARVLGRARRHSRHHPERSVG